MEYQDDLHIDEVVKNTNDAQEAISLIKRYEGILNAKARGLSIPWEFKDCN